jgi:Leucine-rich repeat (LRR) protein
MNLTAKLTLIAALSANAAACGKKSGTRAPQSGDAFPVLPLRLEKWCDGSSVSEEAQRSVDALLRSLAVTNCVDFEARYSSLKPKKIVLAFENLVDPAPIAALGDLQELSVRGNLFTSLAWTKDLEALTLLDAAQNPLGETDQTLDLAGVAPALTTLTLDGTGITEITGASVNGLTSLSLAGNDISSAEFLAGWTQLTTLNVELNPLSDIKFLTGLTGLRSLRISAQLTADLQGLSSLTQLRELFVRSYPGDLTTAADWLPAKLEVLDVAVTGDDKPGFDTGLLTKLTRLKRLNLNGRTMSGKVVYHDYLQELSLTGGELAAEGVLSGMRQLMLLNVDQTGMVALPDLSPLSNLTTIMADGNDIGILDGALLPPRLRTLSVEGNRVSALRAADRISALTNLNLKNNGIDSLTAFGWPQALRTLDLSENSIVQLQPLSTLSDLNTLILSRNLITNPAPLASLLTLEWLDLSHNKLDTIAPLAPLTNLGTLDIRSTGLSASIQCPLSNKAACLF